jgi:hypothetical protein
MSKVSSIEQYIKEIKKIIKKADENTTIVYRGEDEAYPTHCQPNIFRKCNLSKNKLFEKNLFDEMSSNDLTDGQTYLEKAIDAQHGGFPSRLLDVSYNSLVALYFAVTPETTSPEDKKDGVNGEDGVVYIYSIKKLFCPSGQNINLAYDGIVNRDAKWLCEHNLFQINHKLIDHIKKNKRIIAQQGAFILFQGDLVTPIPKCDFQIIAIDKNSKAEIRRDLKKLFGIHTGSIYPEASNLIKEITDKTYKIHTEDFNFVSELELVINTLERELSYFYEYIINLSFNKCSEGEFLNQIQEIESSIFEYKLDFTELDPYIVNLREKSDKNFEKIIEIRSQYNSLISTFHINIKSHISKFQIQFSEEEMLLGEI